MVARTWPINTLEIVSFSVIAYSMFTFTPRELDGFRLKAHYQQHECCLVRLLNVYTQAKIPANQYGVARLNISIYFLLSTEA